MGLLKDVTGWRRGTKLQRRLRDLTGTLVVITGAGSGIGRETALAFAAQGAIVVVSDINLESAQDTAALVNIPSQAGGAEAVFGGGAHAYQVDVSDEQAVIRFAETVAAHHGVPDIVVNNAGIGFSGTFADTEQRQFERVMDINFWGVVYGCRAFTPMMIDRGTGGHVVNLSSAAAYTPQKALTAYSTSKQRYSCSRIAYGQNCFHTASASAPSAPASFTRTSSKPPNLPGPPPRNNSKIKPRSTTSTASGTSLLIEWPVPS
ncbi:SDR family NAD(P)-dependent oxidoreductase [Rhodococcus qingshengii]|uniref:SDR family NAD(P)-dependent oxidoreductase n=1 Tax=Rhodococcus qingshengii TaxID=334542 RepID=UPI0036F1AC32